MGTLTSIFLPGVSQSLYFHRDSSEDITGNNSDCQDVSELNGVKVEKDKKNNYIDNNNSSSRITIVDYKKKKFINGKFRRAFNNFYADFKQAFTNTYVLQWSIWWAMASCGHLQVRNGFFFPIFQFLKLIKRNTRISDFFR